MFEKSMQRAIRRHHIARLKVNRRFNFGQDLSGNPRSLGIAVATAARCSCLMCGNPRKYWGARTIQERRAAGDRQVNWY